MMFVGERRSPRAIQLGLTWLDGGLAAKPLFEALRACGIEPLECEFVNWFEASGPERVRGYRGQVVALGKRVAQALDAEGIMHLPLIHPAARGKIRRRSCYIAHVQARLGHLRGGGSR